MCDMYTRLEMMDAVISCCGEKFFTRGDRRTVLYVRSATGINFQET